MRSEALRPTAILSVVTLLVWTTRIRNIWADDELDTAAQVGRTALALAFTAFAVGGLLTWWRARHEGAGRLSGPWVRRLVRGFAAWTTVVWLVRGVQIALADHGAAFVAVHTVLAVVSIALAVWADRVVHAGGVGDPHQRGQLTSSA